MFKLLKKRFYAILLVIILMLSMMMFYSYHIVEKAFREDYTSKIQDISEKTIADFKIKSEYIEYITRFFVDRISEGNNRDVTVSEYNFNVNVNSIKVYSEDIAGMGIFLNSGKRMVSSSSYLQYEDEFVEVLSGENKACWVVPKKGNNKNLFYVMELDKSEYQGFVIADASHLKENLIIDNIFLEKSFIRLKSGNEEFYLTKENEVKKNSGIHIKEQIRPGLLMLTDVPSDEVDSMLGRIKLLMILFTVFFMVFAAVIVHRVVNHIIRELEMLKNKIDGFAEQKEIRRL